MLLEYAQRSTQKELIDDPNFPEDQVFRTFRDMSRLNRGLGGYWAMVSWVRDQVQANTGKRLKLADVGCGGADFFRHLIENHPKLAAQIDLIAVDGSADALAQAPEQVQTRVCMGALEYLEDHTPDLVVMSLITHHMDDPDIVELLAKLNRQVQIGWLIIDLHRHRFSALSIAVLSRLFFMAPAVCHDGPLSVKRSFIRGDWQSYLNQAGVKASIDWTFLFRWRIEGKGKAA